VKFFLGNLFQRREFINAGVIDQDVDLAERFLSRAKSPSTSAFFATLPWTATAVPPRFMISSTILSASVLKTRN